MREFGLYWVRTTSDSLWQPALYSPDDGVWSVLGKDEFFGDDYMTEIGERLLGPTFNGEHL